jgi:hypothetical protein
VPGCLKVMIGLRERVKSLKSIYVESASDDDVLWSTVSSSGYCAHPGLGLLLVGHAQTIP